MRYIICRITAVALIVFGFSPAFADMPQAGEEIPAWTLRDLHGNKIRFPRAAGRKPAIVFFWATWCPYCKALIPHLAALKNEFSESGLEVFAINFAEQPGKPTHAAFALPLVHLINGDAVAEQYEVTTVPALFLVSPEGRVAYRLDYPPPSHPSQRPDQRQNRIKFLGLWWKDRLREKIQSIQASAQKAKKAVMFKSR